VTSQLTPTANDRCSANLRVITLTMQGLDADHHLRIEFDNVVFRDPQPQFSTVNTDLNVCAPCAQF
jgi:hypothetical protein